MKIPEGYITKVNGQEGLEKKNLFKKLIKFISMTRKEELVAQAKKRYRDSESLPSLEGSFKDYQDKIRHKADTHYCFCAGKTDEYFHYDEEGDTLCNWGMGMGLIYRKGVWAGDIVQKPFEPSFQIYQIYQIY